MLPYKNSLSIWVFQFCKMGLYCNTRNDSQKIQEKIIPDTKNKTKEDYIQHNFILFQQKAISLEYKSSLSEENVIKIIFGQTSSGEPSSLTRNIIIQIMEGNMYVTNTIFSLMQYGKSANSLPLHYYRRTQKTGSSEAQILNRIKKNVYIDSCTGFFKESFVCVPIDINKHINIPKECVFTPIDGVNAIYILVRSSCSEKLFPCNLKYDVPQTRTSKQIQFQTYHAISNLNSMNIPEKYFEKLFLAHLAEVPFKQIKDCLMSFNTNLYSYISFGFEINSPEVYYLLRNTQSNTPKKLKKRTTTDMQVENSNYQPIQLAPQQYQVITNINSNTIYTNTITQNQIPTTKSTHTDFRMILKSELMAPSKRRCKFYAIKTCSVDQLITNKQTNKYEQLYSNQFFCGQYGLKTSDSNELQITQFIGTGKLNHEELQNYEQKCKEYQQKLDYNEPKYVTLVNQFTPEIINKTGEFQKLDSTIVNDGVNIFQMLIYTEIPLVIKIELLYLNRASDNDTNTFIQNTYSILSQKQASMKTKQQQARKRLYSQTDMYIQSKEIQEQQPQKVYNKKHIRKFEKLLPFQEQSRTRGQYKQSSEIEEEEQEQEFNNDNQEDFD